MSLKIEQECDFSGKRAPVKLPKSGPLDLGNIPTPEGWQTRPGVKDVHEDEELLLCPEAAEIYDEAIEQAKQAVRQVWEQAMRRARKKVSPPAPQAVGAGAAHRSSSFNGPAY